MNKDDQIRKFVIMRLMCDLEIDKEEVEDLFGIRFDDYFEQSLDLLFDFIRNKLVIHETTRIVVTDTGRLLIRNIAMCFDAYIQKFKKEEQVFSKTV